MQERIVNTLRNSELFKVLDDRSLLKVSSMVNQLSVDAGQTIVIEGESSDRLFLIENGIVTVKKSLTNDSEKILAYLMPGNTFGEVGILENKPRSATVSALTKSELIEIPRDLFEELLMKFPRLGIELARLLGHYLTQTNNRITRGNKENRLIAIFNAGDIDSGLEFSKSIVEKVYERTGHQTIFIHYQGKGHNTGFTNNFDIDQYSAPYDILKNWDEINFPVESRVSMVADRLLNTYDNLVIFFDQIPKENLSIIYENISQIIILGNSEKEDNAKKLKGLIKQQLTHQNVDFFTFLECKGASGELLTYRSQETDVSESFTDNKNLKLPDAVKLIADRLERNNRIGIFIPTTIDVNKTADTSNYVNEALTFLGTLFGGATSEEAIGVWNSKEIGIVDEKVFIVHSYTSAKVLKDNLNQVVDYVKELKNRLNQESMALEVNKRLTLI